MKSFIHSTLLLLYVVFRDPSIFRLETHSDPTLFRKRLLSQHQNFMYYSIDRTENSKSDSITDTDYSPKYTTISDLKQKYKFITYFGEGKSTANVILLYNEKVDKHYVLKMFDKIDNNNTRFNETELFRELLVSLQLNEVRKKNPNFMFTADIADFGIVSNDKNEYAPYFIMEYVNGINIKKYILNNVINFDYYESIEIKTILFQILYFLYIGNKNINFLHQDLHFNNIQITTKPFINYNIKLELDSNTNNSYYLNGPQIMVFDFGYSSINGFKLPTPGTNQWEITEKGKPIFRESICMKKHQNDINNTHFLWKENGQTQIIKKQTCLNEKFCTQFTGVLTSFLCEHIDIFGNLSNEVQEYITDKNMNYDLKYWLIYFSMLNANTNEKFIQCNTFESCLKNPYFDEIKSKY